MGYVSRDALNHAVWSGIEAGYGVISGPNHTLVMRQDKRGKKGPETVFAGSPQQETAAWQRVSEKINTEVTAGKAWVAGGIPVVAAVLRRIEVPLASVSKARRVLPSQLDLQMPFPVEECHYEFLDIETSAPGQVQALALAVRDEDLGKQVARLAQTGIEPVLMDHEGLALWTQSLAERPDPGLRVIAYLGRDHTALVFGRDQQFLAAHGIRAAWPAEGGPEAFSKRVQRILRAQTLESATPLQWIWCGPGAQAPGPLALLEKILGADQPVAFSTVSRPAEFLGAAYARRAVQADAYPCNFRSDTNAHAAFTATRTRRHRQTLRAYAGAGMIMAAMGLGWSRFLEIKVDRLQTQLTKQAQALIGSTVPRGQERLMVSRFMEQVNQHEAPFKEALAGTRRRQLQDLLQFAARNKFTLNHINLAAERVALKGTAYDWDACDLLSQYFEPRGYRVELVRQNADAAQRIPFTLSAEKKGPS